jgi:hypothetical protein
MSDSLKYNNAQRIAVYEAGDYVVRNYPSLRNLPARTALALPLKPQFCRDCKMNSV